LDGEESENLAVTNFADYICSRASIGQVICSPLDEKENPETNPELMKLSDELFEKEALKFNGKRDVFGFSSIVSLSYSKKKYNFLQSIYNYVIQKSEKHALKAQQQQLKQILTTQNVGLLMVERVINLPVQYIPLLHTELPEDIVFTKKQDDVKDPKEFSYSYLLVISKYTVPTSKPTKANEDEVVKRQKLSREKMYYHLEDKFLLPEADLSFEYLSTFREVNEEGQKINF
jgi:hypothetical protein